MIITCGNRRLSSYRFGWQIEIMKEKSDGTSSWQEDSPAWPASLEQGLEMIAERILTDGPDITIDQLPEALKTAAATVRKYMAVARAAA